MADVVDNAIDADARGRLAVGRSALAQSEKGEKWVESGPVTQLLDLLWHAEPPVRQAAALALAGGDRCSAYVPTYGYFASALLRGLPDLTPMAQENVSSRYAAVTVSLRLLLDQNASELRAMSNMSYSFLSSTLYVTLLSTCRDALAAVHRLRVAAAHPELCRLLWSLAHIGPARRLNAQDSELLTQGAGRALAALPPDEIPEFWRGLAHASLPRRLAVAPALAHFGDRRAVPFLAEALQRGQPPPLAATIIAALGRIGDMGALPALIWILEQKERLLRKQAQSAIVAIERANAVSPARILLRPPTETRDRDAASLLRSATAYASDDPPEQLLRTAQTPPDARSAKG